MAALRDLGLLRDGEVARSEALTGGVSSDVIAVTTPRGRFVVKRSIPRLRVAAEWRAPVERAATEVRWLRVARRIDPRLAPEVLGEAAGSHLFVMRRLAAATHPVWKAELAAGRVDPEFAGRVGADLARIHGATAGRANVARRFRTNADFMALRIEPFLLYTADRNPHVAARLRGLAASLGAPGRVLVHGDISPKNILVGPAGPVFLDAECAVFGDGAFDLAFCLAHLLLKSIWLAPCWSPLMSSFAALRDAYLARVTWEDAGALSSRAAALAGALLLARIDGKSPAGYLDAQGEDSARRRAEAILADEALDLHGLERVWRGWGPV